MATERSGGNLRDMVMAEVTRQLAPLEAKVDRTHYAVERLFNTNGGPEGYLQAARREDNNRFQQIFSILEEHKTDIQPLKSFLELHEDREKQRDKERIAQAAALAETVREADRKFKRYIAYWTIGLGIFMALLALWDHRDAIGHALVVPTAVHSQLEPQDAGIPTHP